MSRNPDADFLDDVPHEPSRYSDLISRVTPRVPLWRGEFNSLQVTALAAFFVQNDRKLRVRSGGFRSKRTET